MNRLSWIAVVILITSAAGPAPQPWADWVDSFVTLVARPELEDVDRAKATQFFAPVLTLEADPFSSCQAEFRASEKPPFVIGAKLSLLLPRKDSALAIHDLQAACPDFSMGILGITLSTAAGIDTHEAIRRLDAKLGKGEDLGSGQIRWSLPPRGALILSPESSSDRLEITVAVREPRMAKP